MVFRTVPGCTPHLAGVDANMDCGSIGLLSLNTLDVDDVLLPVDLHHFADLLAFVVSTDNLFVNNTSKLNKQTCPFKYQIMKLSAMPTIIPGLRHLCGWAWTSHCTSGEAPLTEGKTWSSSWCVRGHWSASCGSYGGRMLQMDSASWCYKSQQNIQVMKLVTCCIVKLEKLDLLDKCSFNRWKGESTERLHEAIQVN